MSSSYQQRGRHLHHPGREWSPTPWPRVIVEVEYGHRSLPETIRLVKRWSDNTDAVFFIMVRIGPLTRIAYGNVALMAIVWRRQGGVLQPSFCLDAGTD